MSEGSGHHEENHQQKHDIDHRSQVDSGYWI